MPLFSPDTLTSLVESYGAITVAVIVGLESMGVPLPGETALLLAAGYAAGHPELNIWVVIAAAAFGAIAGDNAGYGLGRAYGAPFLARYGHHVGISPERLQLGRTLFRRHGMRIVFFGRFVALLRILAAWLAGISHMRWTHFLAANAAGAMVWATVFGVAGYAFGKVMTRLPLSLEVALAVAGLALLIGLHFGSRWLEGRLLRRQSAAVKLEIDER
jgi:membrane protein DedA with SNARE-associated domain